MNLSKQFLCAAAGALVISMTATSHAVCGQAAVNLSQADTDLFNVRGCGTLAYVDAHDRLYDIRTGDWSSRGWWNYCDIRFEYAKHVSAAWVIENGLNSDYNFSFHSAAADYLPLSVAANSNFHSAFWHGIQDGTTLYGEYSDYGIFGRWVNTFCRLYDATLDFRANPASRASTFVHEAWHSWQYRYLWNGHEQGPLGSCAIGPPTGPACDYWYFHGLAQFEFGHLWQSTVVNGVGVRFHSANQAQVEFLCDLAESPSAGIPASVLSAATADANNRATTRFINGPGFVCGNPRPW